MSENPEPLAGQDDPYELFGKWLAGPPKQRQEDAAETLRVSQQYVSALKNRRAVPGPLLRVRLQLLAGIDRNLWPDSDQISEDEAHVLEQELDAAPNGTES